MPSSSSRSSWSSRSVLLKMMTTGILYASDEARNRSMNVVEVSGWRSVTNRKHWSTFAAMMCDCFDRLVDLRIT